MEEPAAASEPVVEDHGLKVKVLKGAQTQEELVAEAAERGGEPGVNSLSITTPRSEVEEPQPSEPKPVAKKAQETAVVAVEAFAADPSQRDRAGPEEEMAHAGAEVIEELLCPARGARNNRKADMSAVVPVDGAHEDVSQVKLNWSRRRVAIPVGDSVLWIWRSEVKLEPAKPQGTRWFTDKVAGSEDFVISKGIEKKTNDGKFYSLKFNKAGSYCFKTSGGGRDDKHQTAFYVTVRSHETMAFRGIACTACMYIVIAIVFILLVVVPLVAVKQGDLVKGLFDAFLPEYNTEDNQKLLIHNAGRILLYFWPLFIGFFMVLIFLILKIVYSCCDMCLRPLASYGKGYSAKTHRHVRIVLAVFALAGFLTVVVSWSYTGRTLDGFVPVGNQIVETGQKVVNQADALVQDAKKLAEVSKEASAAELRNLVQDYEDLLVRVKDATANGRRFVMTMVFSTETLGFLLMQFALVTYAITFAAALSKRPHLSYGSHFSALVALLPHLLIGAFFGMLLVIYSAVGDAMEAGQAATTATTTVGASNIDEEGTSNSQDALALLSFCSSSGTDSTLGGTFATMAEIVAGAGLPLEFPTKEEAKNMKISEVRIWMDTMTVFITDVNNIEGGLQSIVAASGANAEEIELALSLMDKLFKLLDCTTLWDDMSLVADQFRDKVLGNFEDLYTANLFGCAFLAMIVVVSAVAGHVLQRPKKFWYCQETKRWFRFRACYKAHLRVLENNKKKSGLAGMLVRAPLVWRRPRFSLANMWSEMSLAFLVTTFVVLSEGLLLLVFTSGVASKMTAAAVMMLLAGIAAVIFVYTPPGHRNKLVGALLYISMLLKLVAFVLFMLLITDHGLDMFDCLGEMGVETLEGPCAIDNIAKSGKLVLQAIICAITTLIALFCGVSFYCARATFIQEQEELAALSLTKKHNRVSGAQDEAGDRRESMRSCKRFMTSAQAIPLYMFLLLMGGLLVAYVVLTASGKDMVTNADNVNTEAPKKSEQYIWCTASDCCNGVLGLCSRHYDQVVFAMSHNSYSSKADSFSMPNHEQGMKASLEAGVRGLMLDLVTGYDGYDPGQSTTLPKTKLCHKYCTLGEMELKTAFDIVNNFLDSEMGKTEVITIMFENIVETSSEFQDRTIGEQMDDLEDALRESGLFNKLHAQDPWDAWPTLEQLKGKAIIFHQKMDPQQAGNPLDPSRGRKWNHFQFAYVVENPYAYSTEDAIQDTGTSCQIDRGHKENSLFVVNHFITAPSAALAWAEKINYNPMLKQHAQACMVKQNRVPNFLAVDFWSIGDVIATAIQLNEEIDPITYAASQQASTWITYQGTGHLKDESMYVKVALGAGGSWKCYTATYPSSIPSECISLWVKLSECQCDTGNGQTHCVYEAAGHHCSPGIQ